ncbi:MAG: class I SAM-dependent methyltransferase [Gemmatimonadaceae bacterium]
MNRRHAKLTEWGLSHVAVRECDTILDIGCGGGKTVAKLAAAADKGVVHGVDSAAASVAATERTNRAFVELGRVIIQQGSASDLPYPDSTFDLVTAVETHFWWSDLAAGMREGLRVLKPGGRMAVIAEFYNGGRHAKYAARLGEWTRIAILDVEQHRAMFTDAGFADVLIDEEGSRGWLCCIGAKAE